MVKPQKWLVAALALAALLAGPEALAATVSSSATASVSSDSYNTGTSVALPAITVTEQAAGEIPAGTLSLTLPAGFVFDTASAAGVAFSGTGLTGSSTVSYTGLSTVNVSVTATSSAAGSLTIGGSSAPLKVRVLAGAPPATAGNIALTAGILPGINATTSFGTLTQVAGAAAKLAFTVQPPASVQKGAAFSAVTVAVQDQFGNLTADAGRSVTISAVGVNPTTTTGTLGGTLTASTNAGLAVFSGLSYSDTGVIQLSATSAPLTAALSNSVMVINTSTPNATTTYTPPIVIANGRIVKIEGNPTIYMVVNGVLRAFTTPAAFHARGKKFTEAIVITQAQFDLFAKGKNIGNGSDDDATIIILPPGTTASSTAPSLANLPEGTLVKVMGNPTIYIVIGGTLKPLPSMTVLNSYKKDLKKARILSQAELNALPLGSPATFADGTILKGSGPTLYVVKGGQLYGIPSMAVFSKNGHSLKNLIRIRDQEISGVAGVED